MMYNSNNSTYRPCTCNAQTTCTYSLVATEFYPLKYICITVPWYPCMLTACSSTGVLLPSVEEELSCNVKMMRNLGIKGHAGYPPSSRLGIWHVKRRKFLTHTRSMMA